MCICCILPVELLSLDRRLFILKLAETFAKITMINYYGTLLIAAAFYVQWTSNPKLQIYLTVANELSFYYEVWGLWLLFCKYCILLSHT